MIAMVMPVYNESACIAGVLRSWMAVLHDIDEDYLILLMNDGSTDNTVDTVRRVADDPHVRVITLRNGGHGNAVLTGYRMALEVPGVEYVMQTDSDGQTDAGDLPVMWGLSMAHPRSIVMGVRSHRHDGVFRLVSTRILRMVLLLMTGHFIPDANVPFRIFPVSVLKGMMASLPGRLDYTNIILSVSAYGHGVPVIWHDVRFGDRRTGRNSVSWRTMPGSAMEVMREVSSCH